MKESGRDQEATLGPGRMTRMHRPPFDVLLANVDGEVHAIEDACPHSGRSLCEGALSGPLVTCASHGWVIDVRDGQVITEVGRGESNPVFHVEIGAGWVVVCER